MKTIIKLLMVFICCLFVEQICAQDKPTNKQQIESLKILKTKVETEEKELLREAIEVINDKLDRGKITQEEADKLKKEVAKKHALNIENRLAILNNKISFLERNKDETNTNTGDNSDLVIRLFGKRDSDDDKNVIHIGRKKDKPIKYDRRTGSDFVIAFGLNNAIIDGESFNDSPYELGGSRFFEFGWEWRTRVFKNSNFLRFKYGYSFQINGLRQKENVIFVEDGNVTRLEEFPVNLRKSKLSNTNLVFPIHFEFGPSKKIERDDYFRYSTHDKFKIGIGGYAGFNIGTRQKLKFRDEAGNRQKEKIRGDFNTTDFVYGLSGYVSLGGSLALYAKYDLSPIFENQLVDQNNISVGVRLNFE